MSDDYAHPTTISKELKQTLTFLFFLIIFILSTVAAGISGCNRQQRINDELNKIDHHLSHERPTVEVR